MKKALALSAFLSSFCVTADTAFQNYVTPVTWDAKPACNTAASGRQLRITDIGLGGSIWHCDGNAWYPVNGSVLLYHTTTAVTVSGVNTETQIGSTVTIPAGLVTANSKLRSHVMGHSYTNDASSKTYTIQIGTNSGAACLNNTTFTATNPGVSVAGFQGLLILYNKGATNSQGRNNAAINAPFTTTAGAELTYSVDFSVTNYACASMTLADGTPGGDTATIQYWDLWLDYSP